MLPPSYGLQSNARGLPAARLAPTCSPMTQPASECGGIERRHSDIGERPSLVGTWALRRVSMQGEPFWQSPQIDFGSARQQQQLQAKLNADYMQGQHVLREAQQQQQQQVDILLHQQLQRQCTLQQSPQQKLQRAAYSPPTVSCPTSPMGALNIPSGSCPSSAIQSTALGSLSTTQQLSTRSPSNSFQYQIGHGHSQSDIQSTPRQAGPPELPWLQQIKAQDTILESPNMSRVGSLSALDVSWVDDLTGRKDNEDQGLNNSSFQ